MKLLCLSIYSGVGQQRDYYAARRGMNSAAKTGCCIDLEAELDGALFASVRDDRFENPSAKAVCEKIRVSELLIELSPLYSVSPDKPWMQP